jgi:hypothetical protein
VVLGPEKLSDEEKERLRKKLFRRLLRQCSKQYYRMARVVAFQASHSAR